MIKVGIVGGTGYTGAELLRFLAQHPQVEVSVITSRGDAGRPVADLYPNLRGHYDILFSEPDVNNLLACDIVFFATPHGVAQSMMKPLIEGGARVIDLSADFRVKDIATWEHWYAQKHACPELVEQAVYGLPELNREQIREARLVACPGCYPTSIILALLPLLEAGAIDVSSIISSSASGVSGAGRQAKVDLLLAEANESFKAYAVAGHRHLPEIEQCLKGFDKNAQLTFVPHLLPMVRGMHSSVFAKLNTKVDLQSLFEARYKNEAFVDVLPTGVFPQTRSVKASNMCRISVLEPQERGTVVVMSAIDNLAKGASGQGVQNMNLMLGLDEDTGLNLPALLP